MAWVDTIIILLILSFLGLLIWSRVQNQRMADTFMEIKEIIAGFSPKEIAK